MWARSRPLYVRHYFLESLYSAVLTAIQGYFFGDDSRCVERSEGLTVGEGLGKWGKGTWEGRGLRERKDVSVLNYRKFNEPS